MVRAARSVDWVTVANEVEALQLEYSWIKEYEPRFNVRYRDDKSYPYLAITMDEEYPRAQVMRGAKRKGVRYFGPYAQAWAIRETVDQLLRIFPIRTCSAGVFKRHGHLGRPCLLGDIGKCSAPCVGRISAEDHRGIAADLCVFLEGRPERFIRRIEQQMHDVAEQLDFERAARLRDDLAALRRALERTAMVLPERTDADVLAVSGDELESAVQIFYVRGGRVRGQRDFVIERPVDINDAELHEQLLIQIYAEVASESIPRELIVGVKPAQCESLEQWISARRGSQVSIRVPSRGIKRELLATVGTNATHSLTLHKLKRGKDLASRSRALEELRDELGLSQAPLRIECIDISSHSGKDVVASIVVFEDALPRKSEYRRYAINDVTDDVGSIRQTVLRRYRERGDRTRYQPGLLIVDGGSPQVNAAAGALAEAGASDIPVRGLAKRLEEVWSPADPDPAILSRRSEGLYLLQRVRDEAHRVAIAYHRARRSKTSKSSVLDQIPGLGPARKKALLRHFGSVRALKSATSAEVAAVPGIGPRLAEAIIGQLAGESGPAAGVNTATGELLD